MTDLAADGIADVYELDDRTGLMIVPSRDRKLSEFAAKLLKDFYLREGETPSMGYARAARAWCGGDMGLAQKIYDYASKGWFMFASPVLSNAPLPGEKARGLAISCFAANVPDTLEGLIEHTTEVRWLAVLGGGVGGGWSDVRSVSKKAPGPIPFIHTMDADMGAYAQGSTRRGSYAAYLDVSHPDIIEFINLRMPTGDSMRKCHGAGFHNAVNITDAFMRAVLAGADWQLRDPHDGSVRETVKARELWTEILEIRYRTGEPYLHFIDTANRALPDTQKTLGLRIKHSNLCQEIHLPTNDERTFVCCLSSLNAEKYEEWKGSSLVADLITMLDNVLTSFIENAPDVLSKAKFSAMRERALGLGLMGFHSLLQSRMIPFESEQARALNKELFSYTKANALAQSYVLGGQRGEAPDMVGTGRRNSALLAVAPNASSSTLLATSPSIEPNRANAYTHRTRAGSWLVKSPHLAKVLAAYGKDDEATWQSIIVSKGSVQHLAFLSDLERDVFKTAIELDQAWVVRHASDRQVFICQGQSVNLFFPPNCDRSYYNAVHIQAWRQGLKGLYYLRTEAPAQVEAVSKRVDRIALIDHVEVSDNQDNSCKACEG